MTIPAVAVTGYSGFWQTTGDMSAYAMLTTAQGGQRGRSEKLISKWLTRRQQMLPLREIMLTLLGAAAGDTASESLSRVDSQVTDPSTQTTFSSFGGNRGVTSVALVNRATTAADITYITQMLTQRFGLAIASYPADASGNGGGGKLGTL